MGVRYTHQGAPISDNRANLRCRNSHIQAETPSLFVLERRPSRQQEAAHRNAQRPRRISIFLSKHSFFVFRRSHPAGLRPTEETVAVACDPAVDRVPEEARHDAEDRHRAPGETESLVDAEHGVAVAADLVNVDEDDGAWFFGSRPCLTRVTAIAPLRIQFRIQRIDQCEIVTRRDLSILCCRQVKMC